MRCTRNCKQMVAQGIIALLVFVQLPILFHSYFSELYSNDELHNIPDSTRMMIGSFYNLTSTNVSTRATLLSALRCPDGNCTTGWQPKWQEKLAMIDLTRPKTKYYFSEILKVRLYESDKAKWTIRELKQWIHYLLYSGVEHIYICDRAQEPSEKVDAMLKRYIALGLVSYFIQFASLYPPKQAQIKCYQHIIDHYKEDSTWQMSIDMDEYPFVYGDYEEGFLARYLKNIPDSVSELSMHNWLMLGQCDRNKDMVIDRINRIIPKTMNNLDKPIYRPMMVKAGLHHSNIKNGRRQEGDDSEIRMLHFWGARGQDFGPDTPESLSKTIVFNLARLNLAPTVRKSLIAFGEYDAFSNSTGP